MADYRYLTVVANFGFWILDFGHLWPILDFRL